MAYSYEYPRPAVVTDVVVLAPVGDRLEVLLIRRALDPFKDHWALPGGYLEMDEDLAACAARELEEETGLHGLDLRQLHAFGAIDRDPRGRVISVAYWCHLVGGRPDAVRAGDDAAAARWFSMEALPDLAFDHREIIQMAIRKINTGPTP